MLPSRKKLISAKFYIALQESKTTEEKKNDILKCLDEGANINEHLINDSKNTPLHIAVNNEDPHIVSFLLQHGAKVNLINDAKKTALDIAKELNTEVGHTIIKILEDAINEAIKEGVTVDNEEESDYITQDDSKCAYQKRTGTSGIEGQLYETKLLSLILSRALVNEKFNQFYLGTSLGGIDALDDICIRYQRENENSIIFLQAKHRKDENKGKVTNQELWKSCGDFSLPKYFRSYLKIKEKFAKINDDVMYEGRYQDVKCMFIIYTSANHDLKKEYIKETVSSPTVNDLIWSGKHCDTFQYQYTEKDVNSLKQTILVEDMKCLGISLFEYKEKYHNMMSNDYIRKFHVVVAQKVFTISEVATGGFRWGRFRDQFFSSNDELLITIKRTIFREAVCKTKVSKVTLKKLIQSFVRELTEEALSRVLQNVDICLDEKKKTLKILEDTFKDFNNNLSLLKVSPTVFNNALELATKATLHLIHFKLPATFGNTDIAVKKVGRLDYLAQQIENLISETDGKLIVINKNVIGPNKLIKPGFVEKGGIGSAIGNLLILDQKTKMLKFNMNYESLGQNSQKLLKKIESKIKALDTYRLQININDFPQLTFDEECNEIITKDFLNNLWFFTCQAKEDEIEKYGKGVLYEYYNTNRSKIKKKISSIQCDAIFFKLHDSIQKWWLKVGESHYLTNKSKYYNKILNDFEDKSLLSILNYIYITKMDKYSIQFNEDTIKSLHLHAESMIIETEVTILTGIKLIQYFRKFCTEDGNCTFIDLDYVLSLSKKDYDSIVDEIRSTKLETLVIIFEANAETEDVKRNTIRTLVSESLTGKCIIVTDIDTAVKIEKSAIAAKFERVVDYKINLIDLTQDSQSVLLENKIIFQGLEVKWNMIINESRKLITANILIKIINDEKIELGKMLTNSKYEEIKDFYVTRSLRCQKTTTPTNKIDLSSHTSLVLSPYSSSESDEIIEINTLEDLTDVVVLLAAPGMGKSTFLTHLSIATKKRTPGIWIERIDLLDYGYYFKYLKKNNININLIQALKFICKTILLKKVQSRYNIEESSNKINFDIELQNGELRLKNFENADIIELLALEIFIDCYNKRNTIFLFDGFDEICPGYKAEITLLLKSLVYLPSNELSELSYVKQKMWITSRSYNNIRRTLEAEFGSTYILEPFTNIEQDIFMENYLKFNLKLTELNRQQFENIDGLFEYVKSFTVRRAGERKPFKLTDLLLRNLYFAAVIYFQSEIKHTPLTHDKQLFAVKWNLLSFIKATIPEAFPVSNKMLDQVLRTNRDVQNFIQTPLHMYIAINYLKSKIKDTSVQNNDIIKKWNLDVNTFVFYELFFEEKLRTVLFQEKNQVDLNNTDLDRLYHKVREEFIDNHKKIAFYSIFKEDFGDVLTEEVATKIKDIIDKMESGEEKTGIVDYIINGVPKFVHLCFAEYLAVEYMSDLIKTTHHLEQIKLWKFILHKMLFKGIRGVLSVFDLKLCNDSEFRNVILNLKAEVKEFIFQELVEQTLDPSDEYALVALDDLVLNSLRHVARMLLTVVTDIINEHNYDRFNELLKKTTYFCYASVDLGFTELMEIVVNCARSSVFTNDMSNSEAQVNNAEIMSAMLKMFNKMLNDDNTPNENLHKEDAYIAYIR